METQDPTANRLLLALPQAEWAALSPHLQPIPLPVERTLHEAGEPIEYLYFPSRGVASMVSEVDDGTIVEIATIGNEGMVGLSVFLDAGSIPVKTFIQIAGHGHRVSSETFRSIVRPESAFAAILRRYSQALFFQMAQNAVCNRVHPLEKRCARWLLLTHDRVQGEDFELTQKFLAYMLGTRRASVTVAAGILQRAGLIRYSRGHVTVVDRPGLEAVACECYGTVAGEYERLMSPRE